LVFFRKEPLSSGLRWIICVGGPLDFFGPSLGTGSFFHGAQ
jgi:hypothetical protein